LRALKKGRKALREVIEKKRTRKVVLGGGCREGEEEGGEELVVSF